MAEVDRLRLQVEELSKRPQPEEVRTLRRRLRFLKKLCSGESLSSSSSSSSSSATRDGNGKVADNGDGDGDDDDDDDDDDDSDGGGDSGAEEGAEKEWAVRHSEKLRGGIVEEARKRSEAEAAAAAAAAKLGERDEECEELRTLVAKLEVSEVRTHPINFTPFPFFFFLNALFFFFPPLVSF